MFDKNMNLLRAIISTIILCGKQNISLRGQRDDSKSTASVNKGNFHAILMLLSNSVDDLKEHLSAEACSVQGRKKRKATTALCTCCNNQVLNLSVAVARRLTPVTET